VRAEILRVCDKVATRMRAAEVVGRTVTFHVRYSDFGTRSVSASLPEPTDLTGELYEAALRLYGRLITPRVAPRHRSGRIKQWLNMLRRRHAGAQGAYEAVRELNDAAEIDMRLAMLEAELHTPSPASKEKALG